MSIEIVGVRRFDTVSATELNERCQALETRLINAMGDERLQIVFVNVLARMFCQAVVMTGTKENALAIVSRAWDEMPRTDPEAKA